MRYGLQQFFVVAVVAALALFASPGGAAPVLGGSEVFPVVDSFHTALRNGDAKAALVLLDPYVLIYEEGGREFRREEYAKAHLPADIAFSRGVTMTVLQRNYAGAGDFAWVGTQSRVTGRFRGRAVDSVTTETMILRRVRGIWRIVHIHWSSKSASR